MVRLHDYWRSSASYRVRIALGLFGIAYDRVVVDLLEGAQRATANLRLNKQGLVPTLEIDGLVLTQSLAIVEYLEDSRGPMILPPDPGGRARVRALADAIAMEIAPVCAMYVRKHVEGLSGGTMTAIEWQRHYITRGFAALEAMLGDGKAGRFCHGDTLTLADIALMPQVYSAERAGVDLSRYPRMAAIAGRLAEAPAVAAAHPDRFRPAKGPF